MIFSVMTPDTMLSANCPLSVTELRITFAWHQGFLPRSPVYAPLAAFAITLFPFLHFMFHPTQHRFLRDFFGKTAGYLCNSQICIYFAKFFKWVLRASAPDVKQAVAARVCESTINANSNANCKYCKRAEKRSEISP